MAKNHWLVFINEKFVGADLGARIVIREPIIGNGELLLPLSENLFVFWGIMDRLFPSGGDNNYPGDSFCLEIREGESPSQCEVIAKFENCYIEPDSKEWLEFRQRSPLPKRDIRIWPFLIKFSSSQVIDGLGLEPNS